MSDSYLLSASGIDFKDFNILGISNVFQGPLPFFLLIGVLSVSLDDVVASALIPRHQSGHSI